MVLEGAEWSSRCALWSPSSPHCCVAAVNFLLATVTMEGRLAGDWRRRQFRSSCRSAVSAWPLSIGKVVAAEWRLGADRGGLLQGRDRRQVKRFRNGNVAAAAMLYQGRCTTVPSGGWFPRVGQLVFSGHRTWRSCTVATLPWQA
jgi:hypothetical protein